MEKTLELNSELSIDQFTKVAKTLVGHHTNKIETAIEKHQLKATPCLVSLDLKRIGIVQCKSCLIWWWEDQTTNGYCHSLCGGEHVRKHTESIEEISTIRKKSRQQEFGFFSRQSRRRRIGYRS